MLPLIGSLIGAGTSLIGGLMGKSAADDNREAAMWTNLMNLNEQRRVNEENRAFAREINTQNIAASERINASALADKDIDRALQREFAQMGIRWRVGDAKAAGIHPIYALGGSGASYSPSPISLDVPKSGTGTGSAAYAASAPPSVGNPLGNALAAGGQDISRALMAVNTQLQRDTAFENTMKDLAIRKGTLELDAMVSQIARTRSQLGPPMQSVPEASKFEDRPKLMAGGYNWLTDPMTVNAEDYEKRYGELSDFIFGPFILYRDVQKQITSSERYKQLRRNMDTFDRSMRRYGPGY